MKKEDIYMKQIIPFTKDITLKSKIGELTSISLDYDLQLKGEDTIKGDFYIKGKYKLTKASQIEEDFSYKIPCEIAISEEYDTYDATIDIDDFYYDIIDDEILKVNIDLKIDNLVKKELVEVRNEEKEEINEEINEKIIITQQENEELDKILFNYEEERDLINPINIIEETKKDLFNELDNNETYSTYCIYSVQEEDTFEKITSRYNIKKEEILLYNDVVDLNPGMKLVIPDIKNE